MENNQKHDVRLDEDNRRLREQIRKDLAEEDAFLGQSNFTPDYSYQQPTVSMPKKYEQEEKKINTKYGCILWTISLAGSALCYLYVYGVILKLHQGKDMLTHPFYQKEATCIGREGSNIGLFDLDGNLSTCEVKAGLKIPSSEQLHGRTYDSVFKESIGKKMKICNWNKNGFWIYRGNVPSEHQNGE